MRVAQHSMVPAQQHLLQIARQVAGRLVCGRTWCPAAPCQCRLLHTRHSSLPYLLLPGAVGAVPLRWYKDEDHIGYDLEGKKIIKKQKADALDRLLDRNDSKQVCCAGACVWFGARDMFRAGLGICRAGY